MSHYTRSTSTSRPGHYGYKSSVVVHRDPLYFTRATNRRYSSDNYRYNRGPTTWRCFNVRPTLPVCRGQIKYEKDLGEASLKTGEVHGDDRRTHSNNSIHEYRCLPENGHENDDEEDVCTCSTDEHSRSFRSNGSDQSCPISKQQDQTFTKKATENRQPQPTNETKKPNLFTRLLFGLPKSTTENCVKNCPENSEKSDKNGQLVQNENNELRQKERNTIRVDHNNNKAERVSTPRNSSDESTEFLRECESRECSSPRTSSSDTEEYNQDNRHDGKHARNYNANEIKGAVQTIKNQDNHKGVDRQRNARRKRRPARNTSTQTCSGETNAYTRQRTEEETERRPSKIEPVQRCPKNIEDLRAFLISSPTESELRITNGKRKKVQKKETQDNRRDHHRDGNNKIRKEDSNRSDAVTSKPRNKMKKQSSEEFVSEVNTYVVTSKPKNKMKIQRSEEFSSDVQVRCAREESDGRSGENNRKSARRQEINAEMKCRSLYNKPKEPTTSTNSYYARSNRNGFKSAPREPSTWLRIPARGRAISQSNKSEINSSLTYYEPILRIRL